MILTADGRRVIVSIEEHEIGDGCFCTDAPIMVRIVGRLPRLEVRGP